MIRGSSFHLRTIMEKDLDALVLLLGDIERQGDFLPLQLVSERHLRKEFDKDGFWSAEKKRLVIIDGNEAIIGSIWIFKPVPYFDALELGYALFGQKDRGKGLMTEAVGLVVDYLFKSSRMNRLEIRCDVDNRASARVAEKLGFTHERASHARRRCPVASTTTCANTPFFVKNGRHRRQGRLRQVNATPRKR